MVARKRLSRTKESETTKWLRIIASGNENISPQTENEIIKGASSDEILNKLKKGEG
jgi:hypothetical protein